jgi:protein-disulfide isomerase
MPPMEWMNFEGPMVAAAAGLVFAIFSALENRVSWVASLCSVFGEGCRKTADFTILRIPVSWWGIGYYLALMGLLLFGKPLVFWFVMIGLGLEFTFLWTLITIRAFCIFCALNAVAVAALVFFTFDPARIWPAATTALAFFIGSNYLLSRENLAKWASETDPDRIAAEVDGQPIRMKQVKRPLTQRIHNLNMKIYRLQRQRLQTLIREQLLSKEAQRRDCSRPQLEKSIISETEPVTDAEIEDFYRKHRDRYPERDPKEDAFRQEIREILEEKKAGKKIRDYADSLMDRYRVDIYLKEPTLPLTQVNVSGCPSMGPENAPVVVVELSDYLCPACRSAHEAVRNIRSAYQNQVRWIFKDFPLKSHEGAERLAEAAHCAGAQDRFWKFQELLFSSNGKPDMETLGEYAAQMDLDVERFRSCLESRKFQSRIEENIQDAKAAGISATPTFIINGKMQSGVPSEDEFRRMIESELNAGKPS